MGEKQYSTSAAMPPALPYKRRATYQMDAPSNSPMAMNANLADFIGVLRKPTIRPSVIATPPRTPTTGVLGVFGCTKNPGGISTRVSGGSSAAHCRKKHNSRKAATNCGGPIGSPRSWK
jgi:hypothetical protein